MLAETFMVIAWSIWFNRNARRMGKSSLPTHMIYADAVERLSEFNMAHDPPFDSAPTSTSPSTSLDSTPALTYKVNFDGAIF